MALSYAMPALLPRAKDRGVTPRLDAGEALLVYVIRAADGELTAAELLGHGEFSLTRLYESA